jgi:cytoskeletal protein CcmA (bactofilin family)
MFFKKKPSNRYKETTIISAGTEITGAIRSSDNVHILGKVQSTIDAASILIGEGGWVVGNIFAKDVAINGKMDGDVTAENLIELLHHGKVYGNIRTKKLVVQEGAYFDGNCRMMSDEGQVIEFGTNNSLKRNQKVELSANS